jgi:hypothetical protein
MSYSKQLTRCGRETVDEVNELGLGVRWAPGTAAKCGGLSTARRTMVLSVASVEMTLLFYSDEPFTG